MIRETLKKYGQVIVAFTILVLIYLGLTNLPSIVAFLGTMTSILTPFLLGLLFALLLLAPSKGLEKLFNKPKKLKFLKKHKRGISIFVCYIVVFIIIALFVKFAIPTFSTNIAELISNVPTFYNSFIDSINNIPEDSILYGIDFSGVTENMNLDNVQNLLNMDTVMASIKGVFGFASAVFSIFVAIILSVYILLDREKIMKFIQRFLNAIFNEHVEKTVTTYINRLSNIFSKFITSQFLDAIVVGTCSTIVLLILDVKYALVLGPLIGLANMIPYFGAIFATIFAIILTLFTGGIWKAISVLVFILVLQQIDANIINPKILSDNLKMSPLLVIFAVTIGGGFFGVIGMFLAVPIVATIKGFVMEYIDRKEKSQKEIPNA